MAAHLIIIDEAHRSGFGTWNEILKRFPAAIQLGMTATPKRTDNVDTYAYFGEPVFTYSLGQGIDDGFLANYKVHHVRSNLDRDGLSLAEAQQEGAHIYIPEDATPRPEYGTPSFERDITVPDRVRLHCEHLVNLLRIYGRMEKTIVYCVSQDHALEVVKYLNLLNSDLNIPDYAVRIVSEEATAQSDLERFTAVERPTPVVAVTVDLLTTGVDAPSVRNIVFLRTIASPTVFKQIVGRGARLCEDTDKYWFRIIDYTGATALFDEWDRPTEPPDNKVQTAGPGVCGLAGRVVNVETGAPLVDAVVTVQMGPNQFVQQRRIVAKLDALRARVEQALALQRAAIAEAEALIDASLQAIFSDAATADWQQCSLETLADIRAGATLGRKLAGATIRVPYLRVANVQDGRLDLTDVKEIDIRPDELEKWRLQAGDLVLTEGGDFDKLGRGTIWRNEIVDCIHQNHIFRVRPNHHSVANCCFWPDLAPIGWCAARPQ